MGLQPAASAGDGALTRDAVLVRPLPENLLAQKLYASARLDLRVSCKNRIVSDYRFLGFTAYLEASNRGGSEL